MINEETILELLRKGENQDDIAETLIEALNGAVKTFEEEQEAAKKAHCEAALKQKKIDDMDDILDLIYEFILAYYCDTEADKVELDTYFNEVDAEKVINDLEQIGAMATELSKLFGDVNALFPASNPAKDACECGHNHDCSTVSDCGCHKEKQPTNKVKAKIVSPDEVINSFFKRMGL
jgi:hypothetical protein